MCGITGIIGQHSYGFTSTNLEQFEQMLVINSFRGIDSTGIVEISKQGLAQSMKDVGDPIKLLKQSPWHKIRADSIREGRFIFGHGRKATYGTVSVENAHPFNVKQVDKNTGVVSSHIVLVHNGTLERGNEGMKDFDVDSHYMADAIAAKGPREALSNIKGAIAAIWYDVLKKELCIFRNDQRPLFWVQAKEDSTIYMNSEPAPLAYLSVKHRIKYQGTPVLFEPQTLYRFQHDLNGGKKGEVWTTEVIPAPKATKYFDFNAGQYADLEYETGTTTSRPVAPVTPSTREEPDRSGVRFHRYNDIHGLHLAERNRIYELMRRITKGELNRVRWEKGKDGTGGSEIWEYPSIDGKPSEHVEVVNRYPPIVGMLSMVRFGVGEQIEIRFVKDGKMESIYTRPPSDINALLTQVPTAVTAPATPMPPPAVRIKTLTKAEIKQKAREEFEMNGCIPKPGQINRWHGKATQIDENGKETSQTYVNFAKSETTNPFFFSAYGNPGDGYFYVNQHVVVNVDYTAQGTITGPSEHKSRYWCSLSGVDPGTGLIGIMFLSTPGRFIKDEEIAGEIICIRAASKEEHEREGFNAVIYLGRCESTAGIDKKIVTRLIDEQRIPRTINEVLDIAKGKANHAA